MTFVEQLNDQFPDDDAAMARLHTRLAAYTPRVVSNMMSFNDDGVLVGFQGELIHSFNKSSKALRSSPEWERIASRKAVLLLGDNPSDMQMVQGLEVDTVLSVGFLNDRVEERLELYKRTFDVVIRGDATMQPACDLLARILE